MANPVLGPTPIDKAVPRPSAHAHGGSRRRCQVCGNSFDALGVTPGNLVRDTIAALIAAGIGSWDPAGFVCRSCLNRYRTDYVRAEMERDRGELSVLEEQVMRSLHDGVVVSDNLNDEFERLLTFGARVSDKVSEFGGSWRFIIAFFVVIGLWITGNSVYLLFHPFDPYPYILLNLALSLLAAVQAPIILMSQNRQETRDRMRAENDYRVNLKAELEVRMVAEKLDLLIHHQWAHLLEIQQVQTEMIQDILGRRG